ncbi:MAG: DUF4403 family protein [Longimicrobiales bacterium]|nr:DUF4403 family protein [Longimicrobiales bacterium]
MKRLGLTTDGLRAVPWRIHALVLVVIVALTLMPFMSRRHFLDPGRPELSPDVLPPPVVPASVLATPIAIPLAPLVAMMEKRVPLTHGDIAERKALEDRPRTEIAYQLRRAPFQVELNGDVATLRTTVRYAVRAFYDPPVLPGISGSCGTGDEVAKPRLSVTISAPITIDEQWTLRTDARVVDVRPASDTDRDLCRMTFMDIDVTERVVEAARRFLEEHTDEIDSIAAAVNVRSRFEGWWRTLQDPVRLTDSLWLAMRPERVQRGPVRGSGDSLQIALALRARPTLAYGPRPSLPDVLLPSLDTGIVPEGLDLRMEARVEYDAASAFLFGKVGGREFEYDERTLKLDTLRVFGIGGGHLAVELLVSGDVNARLFLVGTPEVEPVSGRIYVPDLDFDVATRNVVLTAVSWLRANELRDILREHARWPAEPAVAWLTGWLEQGLNRRLSDELRVEGEVASVRVLSVHALKEALLVRTSATGSARLFVTPGGAGGTSPRRDARP